MTTISPTNRHHLAKGDFAKAAKVLRAASAASGTRKTCTKRART